ncbi:glycosyltransferase family 4 protein [Bacteroidota bacterium]
MKLCFTGTTSIHTLKWIEYFVNKGHEISFITFSDVYKLPFDGVKIIKLESYDFLKPKNILKIYQLIKKLKKIINDLNPDIVHVHSITTIAYIIPLLKFHPYILSAWGTDVLLRPNMSKIYSLLASHSIKKADLVHCEGINVYRSLIKLGGSKNKIVRINFGTDTNIFKPTKYSIRLRCQLGLRTSPTILSTRNLEQTYDIETLIYTIPKVLKKHPNAKFVVVGSGSQKEMLEELTKKLKVNRNVLFAGWISNDDMPYYLASSDIYVSTSLYDGGLAASTAEAMASELPVIVTDDPNNRYWIKNGFNGFIIPVSNPQKLAKRIIALIEDKKLCHEMGKRNRKIIKKRYNYYLEMEKMEIEYEQLIIPKYSNK